jgi:sugar-phosphatase
MVKIVPCQLECDALLFDLDGVLIDSTSCIVRHWKAWADQRGLDINKIMQLAHGIRTIDTIRLVAPHLDAVKEAEQFNAHDVLDTVGVVAIEGAYQVLASLPEDAWTIVTSGGLALVKARLTKTGLPIPKILVTAEDVDQGKPAPEPYLVGAKRLGAASKRCVVIEDAPAGIEAGKKAGMRVIGIASTHTRKELVEKGADVVIDKLINLNVQETANEHRMVIRIE